MKSVKDGCFVRAAVGRYFKTVLLSLFTLYALPFTLYAAKIYHAAGTTSATFLKLGAGARASAMGGAFTAVAYDPYAIYWNPAALASLEGEKNIGFFHNDHFQGLKQEFMLYTAPAEGLAFLKRRELRAGVWGAGLDYFYTPKDMERRSGANESDPLAPISVSEGKFGAYDLALSAGYGWKYRKDLSLGFAIKAIRQSIDTKTGASAALDLGLLGDFNWLGEDFTAGLSVQNLGPGIKFISKSYDLPLVFKAGLSSRLPGSGALVALEADKPIDNYPSFILGAEYPLAAKLALRAGYKYRHLGNELGAWSGFSAGAGFTFGVFSFDYAFSPFGELGNSHRFSLNARFGRSGGTVLKGFKAAAQPDGAMRNARTVPYEVTSKALMISPRGTKYEIKASAAAADLYALSFRTMLRGPAPKAISVTEGGLPPALLSRLPSGIRPVQAWQFFPGAGDVRSDIALELKIAASGAETGAYSFLYLAKNGWQEVPLVVIQEEIGYVYFSASAPFSTHYVIAVKP
jgi:hypothetical protein